MGAALVHALSERAAGFLPWVVPLPGTRAENMKCLPKCLIPQAFLLTENRPGLKMPNNTTVQNKRFIFSILDIIE